MRCPVHLSIGQEAIAAPLKFLLKKKDIVISGHRAHAHYIGKGCNLEKFIFELYLKEKVFLEVKLVQCIFLIKRMVFMEVRQLLRTLYL